MVKNLSFFFWDRSEMDKKCTVALARAFDNTGNIIGDRLDHLEECCERFREYFNRTGHSKHTSFDYPYLMERDGLHLVKRGDTARLLFRSTHPLFEDFVEFCQFCGTKIELDIIKAVELTPRKIQIGSGFIATVKWQKNDKTG